MEKMFSDKIYNENKAQYLKIINTFEKKLGNYLNFLYKFEERIKHKENNRKKLQKELNGTCDRIIAAGEILEKKIHSSSVRKEIRKKVREIIGKWIYQSKILKRGFEKPLGYAGDHGTIEMFYKHKPISIGLGYYFDIYALSNTLATADIYRKDKMKELIKNFTESNNSAELEILNHGCGSCREIKELFINYSSKKKIKFFCVDQDPVALKFSKHSLNDLPANITINFMKKNIIDLIRDHRNKKTVVQPFSNKQLVYSMGLVDYFADNTLRLFVRFCLKSLVPGGQLIIAHKNKHKNKSFLTPKWFCDWEFYRRDKEEVLKIIKDEIRGCDIRIVWEKTKHMFFLIITKSC